LKPTESSGPRKVEQLAKVTAIRVHERMPVGVSQLLAIRIEMASPSEGHGAEC
jgi:hypothetical protein